MPNSPKNQRFYSVFIGLLDENILSITCDCSLHCYLVTLILLYCLKHLPLDEEIDWRFSLQKLATKAVFGT